MKTPATDVRAADVHVATAVEGQTRSAVVALLVESGPSTAGEISHELRMSAAGVRRHLDALIAAGEVASISAPSAASHRRRGRPAKRYQLTSVGRGKLHHEYDTLAGAALRRIRDLGGDDAVREFAAERVDAMVADVEALDPDAHDPDEVVVRADRIARALTDAGFSADTRQVGQGVQICQHHCPVAHVAAEFPELCEAETERFTQLLGTHVQRLATIANGDCACTTHVPLARSSLVSASGTPTDRTRLSDVQLTSGSGTDREDAR